MKFTTTSTSRAAALLAFQVILAGCGADGSTDSGSGASAATPAPATSAISITAQPVDQTVLTGGTATFSVTALGTAPSYQWSRNGVAIAGATAASYTTPAAAWTDDGASYTVTLTNPVGTVTSTAAGLHLALSPDQAAYESLILASNAGSYELDWNLDPSAAQTSGLDWLYSDDATLATSPLTTGPQLSVQSQPASLTAALALPAQKPTWVLKGGSILSIPATGETSRSTYVGSAIQVDKLAADGSTLANSQLRSGYAAHALTGTMGATPAELAQPYNAIFSNTGVLTQNAAWTDGSQYLTYTARQLGDSYHVFDCYGTETAGLPLPCNTSTTLSAALTAGERSNSDNVTYHLGDGKVATVAGVSVWVANTPRPASSVGESTVEYRIYFQLGADVYTGALVQDGTVLGSLHDDLASGTIYFDYQLRLNKTARDSLAAAVAF